MEKKISQRVAAMAPKKKSKNLCTSKRKISPNSIPLDTKITQYSRAMHTILKSWFLASVLVGFAAATPRDDEDAKEVVFIGYV